MNIGNLLVDDGEMEEIRKLHAESGFDYKMPDLASAVFPIKRSIRHKGKFVAAVAVKLEGECYLFLDHDELNPFERFFALQELHEDLKARAKELGLDNLFCVLPPEVEKSFGPRLIEAGWKRDRGWSKYTLEI